jgi:L-threonylcarbamoyladenylate synthase
VAEVLDAVGKAHDQAAARAAEVLRDGGLVVLPTDTVYGLAADAFDRLATGRIASVKGRDRRVPLPVFVRSPKQLIGLTPSVPDEAERLMAAYWPGPLTMVLRAEAGMRWDLGDSAGTITVRMPLDELALAVVRAVGPLAVTSASRTGQAPPTTVEAAREQLGDEVDLYLDGGARPERAAVSTIVDLSGAEPRILRPGALPDAQVLAVARGDLDPLTASLQTETAEHVGDGAVEVVGEPGAVWDDAVSGSSTAVEPPGDAERAEG